MDEKQKKLKRMAIWLIAVFATVFAVVMALFWLLTGSAGFSSIGMAFRYGWSIFAIVGVLCILIYFIYKGFLGRKK